ncbi:MAG: helicase C-terminal domain-containing protein [Clostridiales bacterium]|nr:helicase C-terminal domain-containing protein [Clostridiales bacterium]
MSKYEDYYSAIDMVKSFLGRDLIGPVSQDETMISVNPLSSYCMGILWPKRKEPDITNTENQETKSPESEVLESEVLESESWDLLSDDDIESVYIGADGINRANDFRPSAMGVSVMLPPGSVVLKAVFSFGKYKHSESQPDPEKKYPVHQYQRTQHSLSASFQVPSAKKIINSSRRAEFLALGVNLRLTVRKVQSDGSKLVTVSVDNALEISQFYSPLLDVSCLFQCELALESPTGFAPVYQAPALGQNDEERVSSLLYRNVLNYGYGHGCSVSFSMKSGKVSQVRSDFMPSEEVLQMMPGSSSEKNILRMGYWTDASVGEACDSLSRFVNEYESWRDKQNVMLNGFSGHALAAETVLANIGRCVSRLRAGIATLREKPLAWESFQLMNEAMLLQRAKTKKLAKRLLESVAWYPFQLAYILQVLTDIVDPSSQYRDSVDLLWFPTGGGKTEAYLGVAAFTIFYRRLSLKPSKDGVAIIMRYTLRLLTIQQFERASALICACDHLRREKGVPGGEISIGLWIGASMTPNHIDGDDGAENILKILREDPTKPVNKGNPVQVTICPWCGQPIDLDGYSVLHKGLKIKCLNKNCEFSAGLPIYVVDDDVYSSRPTLLLSTVDKFARIAWEPRAKSLFGLNCAPPELVIQDELHLISGPLGSLAGIYEIAVEYLCSQNGRYPKVIASTATVKNASEQIKSLYNRKTIQFPPSGADFSDSFFAVLSTQEERPARTYLGLCESGGNINDLMLRVYSNLLVSNALLAKRGFANNIVDQFATIIGYFNALKDLGAADNIIRDRKDANIRYLVESKFKEECADAGLKHWEVLSLCVQEELTSRKSAKEIQETLGGLEIPYPDPRHYSVVLASSMLSVGIDINRLGLMAVYGQPKSNAEYIQATSRVGRQNPGLVLTLFNAARSRDKSHYEQFSFYHKAFYQYVESTSVTPYSARALEKALHCVFVAMLRLTEDFLGENDMAINFRAKDLRVIKATNYILARIAEIRPDSVDFAKDWLQKITKAWDLIARENPDTLVYYDYKGEKLSLLQAAEKTAAIDFPLVLNSLRNVEQSSNVFIKER